jgi:hypothetical protein
VGGVKEVLAPAQEQLARCQRFYQASTNQRSYAFNSWAASGYLYADIFFSVQMRAVPAIVRATGSAFNVSSDSPSNISREGWQDQFISTGTGAASIILLWWTASADL